MHTLQRLGGFAGHTLIRSLGQELPPPLSSPAASIKLLPMQNTLYRVSPHDQASFFRHVYGMMTYDVNARKRKPFDAIPFPRAILLRTFSACTPISKVSRPTFARPPTIFYT